MSTIHNPSQFQPQDYSVVDYFDNQPPQYTGGTVEAFKHARAMWEKDRDALFPDRNCHQCVHCGNGNVRYVVAVDHLPTKSRVCFGCDCVARLEFPNQNAFKLAQIKSRAEAGHARMRIWAQREAFVKANPEVAVVLEQVKNEVHAGNHFAHDVLRKLDQYGSLSPAQVAAVVKSLARDVEFQKEKENDTRPALVSAKRGTIIGDIVTIKTQEGIYGVQFKMLVKLDDGNKIWGTMPSVLDLEAGDRIEFSAPIEASEKDVHFGFFSRPTKTKILVDGPRRTAAKQTKAIWEAEAAAADATRLAQGIRPVAV